MPDRYRKKPVVIDAMLLAEDNADEVAAWCCGGVAYGPDATMSGVVIETREGAMRADVGDWVIKGVAGEFYPCKPDIFAATYEGPER